MSTKPDVTLPEAYATLNLRPPLEFETEALKASGGTARGVGTTTQMLVTAALDVREGLSVLLRFATRDDANKNRAKVMGYVMSLGGEFEQLRNLTANTIAEPLTSQDFSAVYVDHMRDPLDGVDLRILGPLCAAYYAHPNAVIGYDVFDRDGVLLGCVSEKGLATLRERHFLDVIG